MRTSFLDLINQVGGKVDCFIFKESKFSLKKTFIIMKKKAFKLLRLNLI